MLDVIRTARDAVEKCQEGQGEWGHFCHLCGHGDDDHGDDCAIGKLKTALTEFDRPPEVTSASVVYRTGRLTEEDYAEAIEALQLAQAQAGDRMAGRGAVNCAVCEDGDHTAESCHHNPMVLARRWAAARGMWNCYHCGYVAYNDEEAKAHFGRHDDEVAKCLTVEAESQIRAKLAKVAFDFYNRRIGELMHQAEHWAMPEHEYPLAVHIRVVDADEAFQAVVAFDPARVERGRKETFAEMEDALSRPPINPPGTYPPTHAIHYYRSPRYVVERLDALKKEGLDRG